MPRTLRALALAALAALAPLLAACGEEGAAAPAPTEDRVLAVHGAHAGTGGAHAASAHGAYAAPVSARAEVASAAHHAVHGEALPAGELPGTSLFHLASAWMDHRGRSFALPELRGRPSVFVMFYGDCTTACPLLVKAAQDIEAALPEDLREEVGFVMVTFATEADTPEKLRAYAAAKGLDRENWRWLVGSPLQTRQLAALLGVQYRDLGNGMFAHSNVVTVLDREGVPLARIEGLGADPGPAVGALLRAF